jgi:two-component system NarL family response regulator
VSLRVLLVDDHALFLEGLRNLLISEGIEVAGLAHDGLEALAQARRLHPDVILMDIQMPHCDGVAATRLIKAEMPECKIVMLTMSEDEQDLFEAVKSGASGYLLKRLDAADFFAYLAELQAGHPPFSPGLAERILQEFAGQSALAASPGPPTEGSPASDPRLSASPSLPVPLSPRQTQILTLVADGQTYRQVAATIGIAERTVKYHMAEILDRLHLENRAQMIAYAARVLR